MPTYTTSAYLTFMLPGNKEFTLRKGIQSMNWSNDIEPRGVFSATLRPDAFQGTPIDFDSLPLFTPVKLGLRASHTSEHYWGLGFIVSKDKAFAISDSGEVRKTISIKGTGFEGVLQNIDLFVSPWESGLQALNPYLGYLISGLKIQDDPGGLIKTILDLAINPIFPFYSKINDYELSTFLDWQSYSFPFKSDPARPFYVLPSSGAVTSGTIWQALSFFAERPYYEIFFSYRNSSKPVQMVLRPFPVLCSDFRNITINGRYDTREGKVDYPPVTIHEISENQINTSNLNYSRAECYNLWLTTASNYTLDAMITYGLMIDQSESLKNYPDYARYQFPLKDIPSIRRLGLKKRFQNVSFLPYDQSDTKWEMSLKDKMILLTIRNFETFCCNPYFSSGTLTIPYLPQVQAGDFLKMKFSGMVYYIERCEHSYSAGSPSLTTLGVTRGIRPDDQWKLIAKIRSDLAKWEDRTPDERASFEDRKVEETKQKQKKLNIIKKTDLDIMVNGYFNTKYKDEQQKYAEAISQYYNPLELPEVPP